MDTKTRRDELYMELKKHNLEIRSDSRLCYCYINNKLDKSWSLEKVVYELCVTHWLFNFTDYPEICDITFKHYYDLFENKTQCNTYFKMVIQPQIKLDIIHRCLPLKWPWQTTL